MSQEQENFYRHSTVIVDDTKDSFRHLLDFHLTNQGITVQRFIEINAHYLYHLCFNRYPCCQCPPGTCAGTRGKTVLYQKQLKIFFNITGSKLPGHNPRSNSAPHCCCPVNPNLQLKDLDLTMARLLLVNFTTIVPQGSQERNALELLVDSRNNSFAHAKEGKISDSKYQKSMADIERSLLVLAKVYGKEAETRQRLRDIAKQPYNITLCLQYQKTLLKKSQLEETILQRLHMLPEKLPEYLCKDLKDIRVVEGCDARLELWTKDGDFNVEWFKGDIRIEMSDKYVVKTSDCMHSLIVTNTDLTDRGVYHVKIMDSKRTANIDIDEYFTKNMAETYTYIEGNNVELSCAVQEANIPSHWTKNGIIIKPSAKYKIEDQGKSHLLSIAKLELQDAGNYSVTINSRMRSSFMQVKEYFTKALETQTCIEGEDVQFECEVLDDNQTAMWFKDGTEVSPSDRYEVDRKGKLHRLVVINTKLGDKGEYSVKIKHCVRHSQLIVHEYFTQNMEKTIECVEGDNVELSCAVLEVNTAAVWNKNGVVIQQSGKYKIEAVGMMHKLSIVKATRQDSGQYTVMINNRTRSSSLQVKEIPAAIRQLSQKDKRLYLEIIKAGTETRYYIRIMIIGEHGVGKTCLLRRLLGETIDDVESTDGVDIVHRCKIRLSDGQWVFDKVSDKKKALLSRIKRAVNFKSPEVVQIQEKLYSQNDEPKISWNANVQGESHNLIYSGFQEEFDDQSGIFFTAESNRNKLRKHDESSKTIEVMQENIENATNVVLPTSSNERGGEIEQVAVLNNEDTLRQLNPLQVKKNRVETKLDKILTGNVLNELSEFLNDIGKLDIPDEVLVDCGFWDFAGQRHYYATHPIFLNPNALHLLVANIMKDIKRINTITGFDKIGEYVDFWFDSVHSCSIMETEMENSGNDLHPPVIVVCTGIDNCKDNLEERRKEFRQQLMLLLDHEEKGKHLRRICSVSNTKPSNKDFDYLRKSIFEFGKKMKTFGEELPLKWITLERSLDIIREAGNNILSWPDMIDLSSKLSIKDEKEIILFLKYQHKVGSIIYFESLREYIILNQKWLADAFRCLVSDKVNSDITLTSEWKMLEDTGKLEPVLIEQLFQKDPHLEFYKHQRYLLNVMELFGIIVKVSTLSEDGQPQQFPTYYIPCMISKQTSIEEIIKVFRVEEQNCKRTPWLCMEFGFMPLDFFNHILCCYISKYHICMEPLTKRVAIYHGVGVFYLDKTKSRKFILCFSKNTVAIQLWQWKKIEKDEYKRMMDELKSVVLRVKNKYEPRNVYYVLKLKCSEGNIHNPDGRLTYTESVELGDEEYFCEDHSICHNTSHFFQTWFADYSEGIEGSPGAKGEGGFPGPKEAQGATGLPGAQEAPGPNGSCGENGHLGRPGESVAPDLLGEPRLKGACGEDGEQSHPSIQKYEHTHAIISRRDFSPEFNIDKLDLDESTDQAFAKFLRAHKCYDFIPTSSKLVIFDTLLKAKEACFALAGNGVEAAVLWDSSKQDYVGMLTVTDFILILLKYYKFPLVSRCKATFLYGNLLVHRNYCGQRVLSVYSFTVCKKVLDKISWIQSLVSSITHLSTCNLLYNNYFYFNFIW